MNPKEELIRQIHENDRLKDELRTAYVRIAALEKELTERTSTPIADKEISEPAKATTKTETKSKK